MYPEIKFSDSLSIPTYLVYLSLLYCFLVYYVFRRAKFQNRDTKIALDLALILMISGFIGGRLLHIVYEMPEYYLEDLHRIYKFWQGGFVFFGGFILALIASAVYTWKKKISFLEWADFFSPVIALGYGLGRISCLLAGCCYGRFCNSPWAIKLTWDYHQVPRHPTQIYSVLWEMAVFGLLMTIARIGRPFRAGFVFFLWLILHGMGRLMMEYYRDDFRGDRIAGMSISSWISLGIIAFGILGTLKNSVTKTAKA